MSGRVQINMCTRSSTIIWISGLKMVYTVNKAKQRSANVDFTFLCVCARDVYGCRLVCVCVCVRTCSHVLVAGVHSGVLHGDLEFQVFLCVRRNMCV